MKKIFILLVIPFLFIGCGSKMFELTSEMHEGYGYTPLLWSTFNNDSVLSKHLIEIGHNVNAEGDDHYTPLLFACGKNKDSQANYEIAKLLISKGANVNAMTNTGNTPLDIANSMQDSQLIKLLIENGARVNRPIEFTNKNTKHESISSYEACTKRGGSWIWNQGPGWHCGNLPTIKSIENGTFVNKSIEITNTNIKKTITSSLNEHINSYEACTQMGGTWIWNKGIEWHCGNLPHITKPVTIILLNASGSMTEPDSQGDIKIKSVRKIISKHIHQLDQTKTSLGLIAFNNGCASTTTYVNIDNQDFSKVSSTINSLVPNRQTPLAEGIRQVVESIKNIKQPVNLIIISDGMETCGGNPIYEARKLMQFPTTSAKIHVIGYDVDEQTRIQLKDIAYFGSGIYNDANTSVSLDSAMATILKTTQLRNEKFTNDGSTFIFHINFTNDSDVIDEKSMQDITTLAEYIKTNAFSTNIESYTDNIASKKYNTALSKRRAEKEYNKELSKRRAESVVRKLIELGVNPKLLNAYGYGEEKPIRDNNTEEGRYHNRRIEAHFIP